MPTLMEVEAPSSQRNRNDPPSSRTTAQNETTFDDSATVLSRNLLDDTVLSKNLLDDTTLPYDGDGDNNNNNNDNNNNYETNNYLDGSETILSNNTFFGGGEEQQQQQQQQHQQQHHGDDYQQRDEKHYDDQNQQQRSMGRTKSGDSNTMFPNLSSSRSPLREDLKTPSEIDYRNKLLQTGPHQSRYQDEYQDYVKTTIDNFKARHPNKIRDYRHMSPEEKQEAQQHVITLLARLGIGRGNRQKEEEVGRIQNEKSCGQDKPKQVLSLGLGESPILKTSQDKDSFCHVNDTKFCLSNADEARTKVPFSQQHSSQQQNNNHSFGQADDMSEDSDSSRTASFGAANLNTSNGSVEMVRGSDSNSPRNNSAFESPQNVGTTSASKRPATSSGKRGADLVRHKRDHEFSIEQLEENRVASPEYRLSTGMERLSISPVSSHAQPRDLFVASQSPISPTLTQVSAVDSPDHFGNDGGQMEIGWDDDCSDDDSRFGDSGDSLNSTRDYIRKLPNDKRKGPFRELPVNVQLKPGARFHLNKLDMKHATPQRKEARRKKQSRQQRYRLVNFPDPFQKFSKKERSCLDTAYEYINRFAEDRNRSRQYTRVSSAVFSLSSQQVMAVTLKILLDDCRHASYDDIHSDKQGRTILIVRSKEDTSQWESALREGTGCSVLNHAILPLSERIRKSTAEKAAAHDVVLTTFDALKSPDMAIPVDESGHALTGGAVGATARGWYSSRTSSQQQEIRPQTCKQLSVLHRLTFERIIFVDVVGRKCFLGKEGTARASAAIALRGESRSIFFLKSEVEGMSALSALRKCDRRAVRSVSDVLHLGYDNDDEDENDDDDEEAEGIDGFMIDVREHI